MRRAVGSINRPTRCTASKKDPSPDVGLLCRADTSLPSLSAQPPASGSCVYTGSVLEPPAPNRVHTALRMTRGSYSPFKALAHSSRALFGHERWAPWVSAGRARGLSASGTTSPTPCADGAVVDRSISRRRLVLHVGTQRLGSARTTGLRRRSVERPPGLAGASI